MNSKIPTKLSSRRFKLPWFNRELKLLCRKNSRKYKETKRSGKESLTMTMTMTMKLFY